MYSEDSKVRFLLNRHSNSETLLQDILTTPFNDRPGNNIGVFCVFISFFYVCVPLYVHQADTDMSRS